MRAGGWKPFWVSLWCALLVLLPMVGGTVLLTRGRLREQRLQAAESQSGVAVAMPKLTDTLTALVCVAGEEPSFALIYLNAGQNCANVLTVPAELSVTFGEGEATLAECYAAAGPARCREALETAFALPEDTRYLALTPKLMRELAESYGEISVSLAGALGAEELTAAGQGAAAREFTVSEALELTAELDAAGVLPPVSRAAVRTALWDAFFRQKLELLPAELPKALRENSSSLLTDLTAQDYYRLEETLEFLANGSARVSGAAMPVDWDERTRRYTVSDASRAAVQELFNVEAASAQSASGSAP